MSELSEKDTKYLGERIQNIIFEHYRKNNCNFIDEGIFSKKVIHPSKRITYQLTEIINKELAND